MDTNKDIIKEIRVKHCNRLGMGKSGSNTRMIVMQHLQVLELEIKKALTKKIKEKIQNNEKRDSSIVIKNNVKWELEELLKELALEDSND